MVASPDAVRTAVPKAFITLKSTTVELATVRDVFRFCRERLPQYARPRRLEFNFPLPKTISGKVRRNELRALEQARFRDPAPAAAAAAASRRLHEWWETDPDVAPASSRL